MDRRDLLKVLGLGAFGATGYVLSTSNVDESVTTNNILEQSATQETPTSSSEGNQSQTSLPERVSNISNRDIQTPRIESSITFNYEEIDQEFENDELFRQVTATLAQSSNGDRIKMNPGSVAAEELAAIIRAMHGVGTSVSVIVGAEEKEADLTGGTHAGVAALIGIYTPPEGSDQVLVTRGNSLQTARELASSWDI